MNYQIHNAARKTVTKAARAAGPAGGARLCQYVCGGMRLVRGRPLTITAVALERYRSDLQKQIAAGLIEVRTMDGRLVDLSTLEAAAPLPVSPPPNPPEDTLANEVFPDYPPVPAYPGDEPINEPIEDFMGLESSREAPPQEKQEEVPAPPPPPPVDLPVDLPVEEPVPPPPPPPKTTDTRGRHGRR